MEQISPQVMHRLVFTVLMQHLPEAQSGPALQLLTDALSHTQSQVRELAVVAISELPTSPPRRVAALAVAMKDVSGRVRRRAARAIGDQGPAAYAAMPLLLAGLRDPDPSVRRDCVGAVGRLGPIAHAAAPQLVQLLTDPETRTRAVVGVALARIGQAAVSPLLDGLLHRDTEHAGRCATLLNRIAPDDARVQMALAAVNGPDTDEARQRIDDALLVSSTPAPAGVLGVRMAAMRG